MVRHVHFTSQYYYFLFVSDCTERDIFFAIDGGASVGPENFRKQVQFLEQFVQNIDLGSRKIRVGLLEVSNKEQTEIIFGFGSSQNPLDIQYLLNDMPYYNKQERYVGEALKKIYNSVSIESETICRVNGYLNEFVTSDGYKSFLSCLYLLKLF